MVSTVDRRQIAPKQTSRVAAEWDVLQNLRRASVILPPLKGIPCPPALKHVRPLPPGTADRTPHRGGPAEVRDQVRPNEPGRAGPEGRAGACRASSPIPTPSSHSRLSKVPLSCRPQTSSAPSTSSVLQTRAKTPFRTRSEARCSSSVQLAEASETTMTP